MLDLVQTADRPLFAGRPTVARAARDGAWTATMPAGGVDAVTAVLRARIRSTGLLPRLTAALRLGHRGAAVSFPSASWVNVS